MAFLDDFTFTRGTGKTRTNLAGLIVGVDFSATSNTITTGSKTFVLAADLNVNRDWIVGKSVIAVAQGGEGSMTGTVTSYTPSTQTLVLNITAVTGTGTSTNWRIGSLEITRDALTGAVESHAGATNLVTFSEQFENAAWTKANLTINSNVQLSPDGSSNADKFVEDTANALHYVQMIPTIANGSQYVFSCFIKAAERQWALIFFNNLPNNAGVWFNVATGQIGTVQSSAFAPKIESIGGGWYKCSVSFSSVSTTTNTRVGPTTGDNIASYVGDGSSGIYVWGAQLEIGATPTPYIPTTTVQVTRAADSFALTASALARITAGATLYTEIESADVGPAQKRSIRLSGPSGDIRLAKRGTGNFSGFTKQLEVDDVLYFGTTAGNSQRDNGKEMLSFQAAINERTGAPETIGNLSALAYDGTTQIAYAGGNVEERFLTKDLALWSGKGFGSIVLTNGHWNGSRFLFASATTGIVFLSNDGLTWRRVNTPVLNQATNEITSMLVGGTLRNLIVGAAGFAATSDDNGETWTARTTGTAQVIRGATNGLGLFVVSTDGTTQQIRTSTDGITWTPRTTAVAQSQNDVAFNGTNLFISVGNTGSIQSSPDGITWTSRTSGAAQGLLGIHFANNLWVAVGVTGTIVTSPDGITWTTQTSGVTVNLNEVNYFNGLFVAVGNGSTILTSPNGVTWTTRPSNLSSTINGVAASPSRVVVAGSSGAIATSDDALVYTSRTNNAVIINGMAYGNGVFVSVGNAVGGSGYIATIDAAGNYTRRVSNTTQTINNMRFLNGLFIAPINSPGAGQAAVLTSTDGVSWTLRIGTGTATNLVDVAFGNGLYVAMGQSARFITSADGITWATVQTSGLPQSITGLAFANGLFVAVGNVGVIATSTNGTTWTLRTSGTTQNLTSVMYSNRDQLWYAAGAAGTVLYSADAITWLPVQNAGFGSIDSTTLQAAQLLPPLRSGRNRLAISYRDNAVISSLNGVSKTDSLATIPAITAGALGENLNGLIHKTMIYPATVTEAEINAMTGL